MDNEAASFLVDRLDLARLAITEARQTLEKFDAAEDAEVKRVLEEVLSRIEQLDMAVKQVRYSLG